MATVLITGANRGIGLALARAWHAAGNEVIGVCRSSSEALDKASSHQLAGQDLSDVRCIEQLPSALSSTGIRSLDILMHNAGVLIGNRWGELGPSSADAMLSQFTLNAIAPVLLTHALRDFLGQDSRVGIITSRMGSIADNTSGGSYGYRMSKAAVNAAGKSLAIDLKPAGVAVALIHPGYVRTDMTEGNGQLDPPEAAAGIVGVMDRLSLRNSGQFWHSNGSNLPW